MNKDAFSLEHLRTAAEQQLAVEQAWIMPSELPEMLQLVHELQVHQIEFEMQQNEMVTAFSESEAMRVKYQDIVDLAPVGIFSLSSDGAIIEMNRKGEELLGLPLEKLQHRQFREFFEDESLQPLQSFISSAWETAMDVSCELLQLRRRNALPLYVNAKARVSRDVTSGVSHVHIVLMDVTSLKHATDDVLRTLERNALKP